MVDVVDEFDFFFLPLTLDRKFKFARLALEAVLSCSWSDVCPAGVFSMARLGRFLDPPSLLSS
jgi:hypothetical protein